MYIILANATARVQITVRALLTLSRSSTSIRLVIIQEPITETEIKVALATVNPIMLKEITNIDATAVAATAHPRQKNDNPLEGSLSRRNSLSVSLFLNCNVNLWEALVKLLNEECKTYYN